MIPKEALIAAFKATEPQANEGHYLDRIIAIAGCYCAYQEYLPILHAYKQFLLAHHKPGGLDEIIYEVSYGVIVTARRAGLADDDFAPIVWGLCCTAMEDAKLDWVRIRAKNRNVEAHEDKALTSSNVIQLPTVGQLLASMVKAPTAPKTKARKGSRLQPWQLNGGK